MPKEAKTIPIQLRVSPTQKQIIWWAAEASGMKPSQFMRSTLMNRALSLVDVQAKQDELVAMAAEQAGMTKREFEKEAAAKWASLLLKEVDDED